jgi:hypothetical protein
MSPRRGESSRKVRSVNPGPVIVPKVESDESPVNVGPIHVVGIKPEEIEKLIKKETKNSDGEGKISTGQKPGNGGSDV